MRISTKLTIAAVTPVLLAVGVIVGLTVTNRTVIRVHEQESGAVTISRGLGELNDLARTYIANHEERPRLQFGSKFAELQRELAVAKQTDTTHADLVDRLDTDVTYVGSLFAQIVVNYERGATEGDPVFAEAERRLAGQLFLRSRDANTSASRLVELYSADIVAAQRRTYAFGTASAGLGSLLLTVGLLMLLRSVSTSIARLSEGTEVVGGGNLAYRISLDAHDELSDLARSFNRMAARLQKVTVSSEELEREIEQRTRFARELDAARHQLETILSNMAEAVGVFAPDGTQIRQNDMAFRMYGYHSATEAMRRPADDITFRTLDGQAVPPEQIPSARVVRGESFSDLVLEVTVASTGRTFVGSYSGAPVREEAGEVVLGVVTTHDVTQEYEAQRQARHELETTQTLLEAAGALTKWTDLDQLLRNLADLVLDVVAHRRVLIGLVDHDSETLRLTAGAGEMAVPPGRSLPVENLAPQVQSMLRGGGTTVVDYLALAGHEPRESIQQAARLVLYVPLTYGGRALGFIAIDDPAEQVPFSEREVELVEAVASQASVAVENARRFEVEHDIAERLQTALLELPDSLEGVDFGHLYRSASQTARVGGDFYDLFDIDGHLLGVTIGDVAGKGLNAAALTSLVKNSVRAHASEGGRSPADVLALTNEVVHRSTPPEAFVTVWFGVLDRLDGTLRYASAGHTPGILACADGSVVEAPATGPVLGAFPGVSYSEGSVQRALGDGDLLFLYTDGLSEARGRRGFFGDQRIAEAVARHAAEAPAMVVADVAEEAIEFAGGQLLDDLAILALRRSSGERRG